jgi:cell division protein FtsB
MATDPSRGPRPRRDPALPPRPGRVRQVVHAILLFVAVVLVIDALVGDQGLLQTRRARRRHAELSATLERLRRENAALRERARRLREDPAAIEEEARRELGLVRPDELIFIITDAPPRR